MHKIHCDVSDISNSEGKTQVKNALDKVKGVQKVGVNLRTGAVDVCYNEPASETQIKDCIVHTGFTIT